MLKGIFSKPYSEVFIIGDNSDWAIDQEAQALQKTLRYLGIKSHRIKKGYLNIPQIFHYGSQFSLLDDSIYKSQNRISIDYYHGKPEQGENFKKCFEAIKNHKDQIVKIRVSTKEMERLIGDLIGKDKVMRIPIGVDLDIFKPQTPNSKLEARSSLGIPQDAFVIGSFQKDGNGWGEGNEPKLIKGPDIFLEVIAKLKGQIPKLFVLLSGPSRGYVKNGLTNLGVQYSHHYIKDYKGLNGLYDALDAYLVTSREEGGPKAILESMAKGTPLVTTAVGQAVDLVINGQNAMISPIEDAESLSGNLLNIYQNVSLRESLKVNGLKTAESNSLKSQTTLWKEYLNSLINS